MYYILDLEQNPPVKVPNIQFDTELEACKWIDENGDAVKYTIIKEE